MREIRQHGSEGGGPESHRASLPLSGRIETVLEWFAGTVDLRGRYRCGRPKKPCGRGFSAAGPLFLT